MKKKAAFSDADPEVMALNYLLGACVTHGICVWIVGLIGWPIRHGHYSMRHPWKFDWMGKHIAVAPSSDLFPSVSGSGTGVAFYTSDHFPEKYRNKYLIADWTNNCIFLYNPKWVGALQVPAEKKSKIIDGGTTQGGDLGYKGARGRSLFRPTDIEIGPDGALYIAGWGSVYGTEYVPNKKWTAEENAKYQGRVFRLIHKESPLISREKWDTKKRNKILENWSFDELLEDLGSNVHVWRVHAQDELIRRGHAVSRKLLMAIKSGILDETQATWAMWAIGHIEKNQSGNHDIESSIQKLASDRWQITKKSTNEADKLHKLNIRIQATRILGETKITSAAPLLLKLLEDQEPRIRLAAMGSLDLIGWGDNIKAILNAVAYETERVTYYTNWQVMRRQIPKDKRYELLKDERFGIRRMAALSLMEDGDRELQKRADEFLGDALADAGSLSKILTLSAEEKNFRDSTLVRFTSANPGDIYYTLDGSEPTTKNSLKANKELKFVTSATLKAAVFKDGSRISEIETLELHKISDSEWKDRLFVRSIRGKGSANLYSAQLDGLQRGTLVYADRNYTFTEVPEALAGATHIRTHNEDKSNKESQFLTFETNLPATLYFAYDDRTNPTEKLISGMKRTPMKVGMSNGESFSIYSYAIPAGKVTLNGNKFGGSAGESMYQVFLTKIGSQKTNIAAASNSMAKTNLKHGEEIFFGRGTCLACHQVKGKGVPIGPDLNGISKRRDADYVIRSILVPDEYIVEGFQQTSLELEDNRKLFGMIQEETAQALKIYLLTGEQISVDTKDIIKRNDAKNSSMPSSFSHTLSAQDVADVTAWIMELE